MRRGFQEKVLIERADKNRSLHGVGKMSTYKRLLVEREGNIAIITLNRPDKRNALSSEVRRELEQCLGELEIDKAVKVAILSGSGSAFCAGFDTNEFMTLTEDKMKAFFESSIQYHLAVMKFQKPLIAAINGPAMAGGLDLALMCDFRVASENAVFGHPEIKFGATPLYTLLRNVIGDGLARDLCLTGRRIDAQEAFRTGLLNKVVPQNKLIEEAKAFASQISEAPDETLKTLKKTFIEVTGLGEFEKTARAALGAS